MTQLAINFDTCSRRHRGSPESRAAFERVAGSRGANYERILAAMRGRRMTSKEIAAELGERLNCISGRLSEMRANGMLRASGYRRDGCAVLEAACQQ